MRLPRIVIVVMSAAVVVITSISMNAFSLFLTPIETAFGWSRTTATVPYVFAMLGWAVGGVLFGKKADDLGTRPVILGGVLLMAAGFFGMGLSQNLWQLSLTFGIMTGMAKGACGLVIISLLVAKHYEASNRGLAVSIVQTASPMSPFFLAWPLHYIIVNYDWRMAAMFCGVLLLFVAFPFGWVGARDPDPSSSTRRERASWGSCLPYLRDRNMLLLFAARFSCGFALFQSVHLVAIALEQGLRPGRRAGCRHRLRSRRRGLRGGLRLGLRPLRPRPGAGPHLRLPGRRHFCPVPGLFEPVGLLHRGGAGHGADLRHHRGPERHVLRDGGAETGGTHPRPELPRAPRSAPAADPSWRASTSTCTEATTASCR